MNVLNFNIYENYSWKDYYSDISENITEYLKIDNETVPPIINYFCVLFQMNEMKLFDELLEKLKQFSGEIGDLLQFIDVLNILTMISKKTQEEIDIELKKIEKKYTSKHFWVIDSLFLLKLLSLDVQSQKESLDSYKLTNPLKDQFWSWYFDFFRIQIILKFELNEDVKGYLKEFDILTQKLKFSIFYPFVWNLFGIFYRLIGNFDKSRLYYEQTLNFIIVHGNNVLLSSIYNNLAIIYFNLGNYEDSERYLKQAIKLTNSPQFLATCWGNLGFFLFLKGDLNQSFQAYEELKKQLEILDYNDIMSGYFKSGMAYHKAVSGNISEALEIFKQASKEFESFGHIRGLIHLNGNLGRLFYDIGELKLANRYFGIFLGYFQADETNYHPYYSYYCLYVRCLIDQYKMTQVENHLSILKEIKLKNSQNRIIKSWYHYIYGIYEFERTNLQIAEEELETTINLTKENGPYELLMRSILQIVEIKLRQSLTFGKNIKLNQIKELLEQADEYLTAHPIFPIAIYVKLYKAMFLYKENKEMESAEYIKEAELLIEKSGQVHKRIYFSTLINQLKNEKHLQGSFERQLLIALHLGSGRQLTKHLDKENLGIIVWKLTDIGPDIVETLIPENLIPAKDIQVSSIMMGTLFTSVLGQGKEHHQGIFGPLPVPMSDGDTICQISSRIVKDSDRTDPRYNKTNFVLVGIFYSGNYSFDRIILQDIFNEWWPIIKDLTEFSKIHVKILQSKLINQLPIYF